MPGNFNPANPANPFADYGEKQLYDFLKSYELPRDIGSQYEYSNYAVGLLGHVMARRKGKTYEALMIDVIAKPLNLPDTRIAFTPNMKKNLAMGHHEGVQVESWDLTSLAGAGAIRSTAIDMLKYVRANMGKEKSKLYPAMQLSHKNSRAEGTSPMVGLGWHITPADKFEIVWHNGGTDGYRSFAGFIKGQHKGVVVLTNSTTSADDIGMHILNPKTPLMDIKPSIGVKMRSIIDSQDLETSAKTYWAVASDVIKEVVVDTETLETYVGKYELAPGFILTVSRDGSQLKAQATGQPEFSVYPKSKNVFYFKVVEAQLTFIQSTSGVIESVTLHQGGRDMVGKKLKE